VSNILMHAPALGFFATEPVTLGGRKYVPVQGTPVSVPDYDATALEANGWVRVGETGTTAQRPTTGLFVGRRWTDSTVGGDVVWDGKNWRHHVTGSIA
jgi:hypothetical protein